MDHSLKLRVVEASPIERWTQILPLLPGESENEYKLRVMNISLPWTQDEEFRDAYLSTDVVLRKKYVLGTTTKLLVCTLETLDDKALRDLFISYGAKYLNLFLESMYQLIGGNPIRRIKFYIQCMGRAFYNLDKNSWPIVTERSKPIMLRSLLLIGFCIECVLNDDEEIFDLATEKQPESLLIYEVAVVSSEAHTTKYLIKIIEYIADSELEEEEDQEKTDAYLRAMNNIGEHRQSLGIVDALIWTIRAIKDHSKWSLQDILTFILKDKRYRTYEIQNIYQALHLAGLPIQEIISIVESDLFYDWNESYIDWKESLNEEDV